MLIQFMILLKLCVDIRYRKVGALTDHKVFCIAFDDLVYTQKERICGSFGTHNKTLGFEPVMEMFDGLLK
ncbi:MAG: hypothetical protein CMK36_01280 [Porticoccaceae bacterium]|nr:hypothetical protein [Porticoccaceae bacterium]